MRSVKLPQIYAEKWNDFATKRLTKKDAMSKFNAEQWMSVQFFNDQCAPHTELRKTRSASHLPLQDGTGNTSKSPAHHPLLPERHRRGSLIKLILLSISTVPGKNRGRSFQSNDLFGGLSLKSFLSKMLTSHKTVPFLLQSHRFSPARRAPLSLLAALTYRMARIIQQIMATWGVQPIQIRHSTRVYLLSYRKGW